MRNTYKIMEMALVDLQMMMKRLRVGTLIVEDED